MAHQYNNTREWKYQYAFLVYDFGIKCGDSLAYYQRMINDTTILCPGDALKLFWIIK